MLCYKSHKYISTVTCLFENDYNIIAYVPCPFYNNNTTKKKKKQKTKPDTFKPQQTMTPTKLHQFV